MGKISLPELASTLQERRQLNKKEASQFVNEMFRIIQESLDQDKLVKVKGLGTFRIIDVEDRESVNVNTGDRVLIEGHGKITFTPDALMKELVNKPFSQFETVVLNEGVDFDDATLDENTIAEPAPEAPAIEAPAIDAPASKAPAIEASASEAPAIDGPAPSERSSEPISEPSSEAIPEPADQAYDNPSVAPLVDFVTDPDIPDFPDNPDIPDNQGSPDSPDIPGSPETPASEDTPEPEPRKWLWPLIALATCIIGFVAGYFLGKETTVQPWTPDQTIVEKPSPAIPAKDSLQSAPQTDSTAKGIQPDAMPSPARQDEPIKTVEAPLMKKEAPQKTAEAPAKKVDAPAKKVDTPAKKPEAPAKKAEASPKPAPPATTVESPDKYEQMDVRIRAGAYRIVGLDHTLKVRPGDNLARICKRTLGPGMECYIEVFNGIKGDADLKTGQTIKIPKLQSKRKKTRN